jgi:hypothetical protein
MQVCWQSSAPIAQLLMSVPQSTIAIVYDYDQTLSPNYMQEEAIFPHFGIDGKQFWQRCGELVQKHGFEHELAYMKALLDYLEPDRPTNAQLRELGAERTYRRQPDRTLCPQNFRLRIRRG